MQIEEITMPRRKSDKLPVSIKYERARVEERKTLQFIPNTVKNGEAIIVRTKKWAGISEPCFVVVNNKGEITIRQIKEEETTSDELGKIRKHIEELREKEERRVFG